MVDVESIWELYGLKTNPFSTSPLLVQGGVLPIGCFFGREAELKRLARVFSSGGGNRLLVCGDVGVGKTTLVNFARYTAFQKDYFTPFKEIAVRSNWTADSFILNTLYAIFTTLKLRGNNIISSDLFSRLQNLVELSAVETKVTAGSVSVLGSGVGGEVTESRRAASSPASLALTDFAQEVFAGIREKTGKDVILHYNNLERLDEKKLKELFEDLRDFFQSSNVNFVFVGNLTVHAMVLSLPRVSSIMSDTPILLPELSFEEINEILKRRIEKLRISEDLNFVIPYREDAIKTLFKLYGGNIRNILNSLSTAIVELTNEKPIILESKSLARTLRLVIEQRYLTDLSPRARDVLREAVNHNEVTNKALASKLNIARSNTSTYIRDLESRGCIYLRRKDGKDKYWSVEPKIKWLLLGKDIPKPVKPLDKKQRKLFVNRETDELNDQ